MNWLRKPPPTPGPSRRTCNTSPSKSSPTETDVESNATSSSHGYLPDKTLATLDLKILPRKVRTQIPTLCDGEFIERSENLLALEFAKIKSGDVLLPTLTKSGQSNETIRLRCVVTPDKPQQVLLQRLGLKLPRRLRRIDEVARL